MQLSPLRFDNKPVEFLLSIDEDTPYDMYGDDLRVKQILNNILSNAYRLTDRGKVELSVRAEIPEEAPNADSGSQSVCVLVLRVSDTGQGMSEEQLDKLFDENVRFDYSADHDAIGRDLGMSITKRLVDAMSGEISVESEPGKGSVITVRLPQRYIGSTKCGAELADELRGRRFTSMSKAKAAQRIFEYMPYGRVLIVDDFESNRNVAKGIMLRYGLNIETAASGFEAVDKIGSGAVYDIVFMDYMMPKMDGLETTKRLRDMGYTQPVIALTANVVKGQNELFVASGCDGHLYKPIDIRELDSLLNRLIRDKQPPELLAAARQEMRKRRAVAGRSAAQKTLIYDELVSAAVRDAEIALKVLEDVLFRMNAPGGVDMELFTTTVHGMKSSLANIDEIELMSAAHKLEKAGINKVITVILAETPHFIEALRSFIDKSKPSYSEDVAEPSIDDAIFLLEKMYDIKKACKTFDIRAARIVMIELKKKAWPQELRDIIDDISVNLIRGDFKKVVIDAEKVSDMFFQNSD
jgi:CheY-like chemotaxis protein/anti-sigma regulatory factor (Ser/Thr protein kinase)